VGRDPEAEYFQTVEDTFVSRRGDPLFLSNADWLLVRKWRRAGVPLRVVLRGIADALEGHAHSFSRDRKVRSLQYCAGEVDAAAERWRRALAGADAGVDVGSRLAELADRLERASLKASGEKVARKIAAELRELEQATLSEQSAALAAAETKLLRALEKDLGEAEVARVEAEAEAVLAPYRSRLPEKVLAQVREESRARRLLEAHGLPRLSLFHGAEDTGAA
jgi:hypothetical protein